jgi:hypothetical protein
MLEVREDTNHGGGEYKYSSARYYENDEKNFAFLKDLLSEF